MIGRQLAQYEILEPIGAGGMGEVYRARDGKLGREVAIKVLPQELSEDRERIARLEREAKLLASLNHPAIATLYGFEVSDGTHFLVMELVPGETLSEKIARAPIAIDEALVLFRQIAEGLEAAHEHGVIHRDLKPANIRVTPEGKPKILDFGLAKSLAEQAPDSKLSESPTATKGTAPGVILGTAAYMSPEQARGKSLDTRTDIWSFGCVLYEALTGRPAFLGETLSDTIAAILDREPNWRALPQPTPPRVEALLHRCLEKNARRRFQHIGDVRLELEDGLKEPIAISTVVTSKRSRGALVVMALVTLISLGVAARSLLRAPVPPSVVRTVIPLAPERPFALQYGGALALSPDRRVVAYVAQRGGKAELFLRRLDQSEATLVAGSEGASTPFFSPDGQWVGFLASNTGEIRKVSVSGGAPIVVPGKGMDRGAAWSDGMMYFSGSTSGITKVPEDGGEPVVVTATDPAKREKAHRYPEVLPGGRALVYTAGSRDIASWDEASIVVVSLQTGESRVLIEGGMDARYSPSGHLVYARGGSLLAVPFDLDRLEVKGAPVRVLDGVAMSPISGAAEYSLSRDGWLIYAPGGMWGTNRVIVSVDRDGRSEPLIDTPRAFMDSEVSPDGRRIAVSVSGANDSVWVGDLSRGTLTRVAFGADNLWPIWTPDGGKVAFSSDREGPYNLYWQAADGSAAAEALTPKVGAVQHAGSWARDGKTLVFQQSRDVWIGSADGTTQPLLKEDYSETHPRLSPSGHWLAYVSNESGQNEVYVQRFPELSQKQQVSVGGGTEPLWNPKGSELFYRNGSKLMVVVIEEREGRLRLAAPRLLFERSSPMELLARTYSMHVYDVTPDGERFVTIAKSAPEPPPTHLVLIQNWAEELERLAPSN